MSQDVPKCPKSKPKNPAKQLRDISIAEKALEGLTHEEIASETGLSRRQVGRILNGPQLKTFLRTAENRFQSLADKAVSKVEEAIDQEQDLGNALKAALAVLKSTGIAKDTIDHNLTVIKPTIITRPNGETVTLGVAQGDEE